MGMGSGSTESGMAAQGDSEKKLGPVIARFPRQTPAVEAMKLEYEEAAEEEGESKPPPPRNMAQVYLMGAYLIARWVWARFQERQKRRDLTGRDDRKD